MPEPSLILVAALVAAAVAALGHLVVWQSQKRSSTLARSTAKMEARLTAALKLVEFRQRWIDRLRDQMSSYLALALRKEQLDDSQAVEMRRFGASIRLHMNPDDSEYETLKGYISELDGGVVVNGDHDFSKLFPEVCQRILKREWDVLKEEIGEFQALETFGSDNGRLGSRLVHSQKATAVASATPDRKLVASLS